jgi:hypothetical protein
MPTFSAQQSGNLFMVAPEAASPGCRPPNSHGREAVVSPNPLAGRVAHEMVADRIRAAEHHRLVSESRPARAPRRSPLALLALLRRGGRRAPIAVSAPADA